MLNSGKLIGLAGILVLLNACSAGDDTSCTNTNDCADLSAFRDLSISYPSVDTINHVTDNLSTATGTYEYAGSVTVTDADGNTVPDGTFIKLNVIDTVIAGGTIDGGDSISGTSLVDAAPIITNGTADFTTAGVTRDGTFYRISGTDSLLLDGARGIDKAKSISGVPGLSNTLNVTQAYSQAYPNAIYPATPTTSYVVGRSLLGMNIYGIDPEDSTLTISGGTRTKGGVGVFRIRYPANEGTIRVGCGNVPAIETRFPGETSSADVFVIAQIDGYPAATVVDSQACFFYILPDAITGDVSEGPLGTVVTLTHRDSEQVGIPYTDLTPSPAGSATSCTTLPGGSCQVTITAGAAGDEVVFNTPNGGTAFTFTIN